jgi:hypothetical protein
VLQKAIEDDEPSVQRVAARRLARRAFAKF